MKQGEARDVLPPFFSFLTPLPMVPPPPYFSGILHQSLRRHLNPDKIGGSLKCRDLGLNLKMPLVVFWHFL